MADLSGRSPQSPAVDAKRLLRIEAENGSSAVESQRATEMLRQVDGHLVVTAAFTEETLYRAYPIGRLEALTGSVWPGAIITFVLFVVAHVGTNSVVELIFVIAPVAAAMTALYLWKRNFFFVVIVHFVVDSHLWIRPLLAAIADA